VAKIGEQQYVTQKLFSKRKKQAHGKGAAQGNKLHVLLLHAYCHSRVFKRWNIDAFGVPT